MAHPASRRLLSVALSLFAGALFVTPADAQDFAAVERRLGEGVAKGELNLEQAKVMLDALRRHARQQRRERTTDRGDYRQLRENYDAYETRLKAAAERWEVSRQDAAKKLKEYGQKLRKAASDDRGKPNDVRPRARNIERQIRAAVQRGDLTLEQANAKRREYRRQIWMEEVQADRRAQLEGLERQIKEQVEIGESLVEYRRDVLKKFAEAEARIDTAIQKGEITREQGADRMKKYRSRLRSEVEQRERDFTEAARRTRYESVERRVKAAVERGDMTREEAGKKLFEFRTKALEEQRKRESIDATKDEPKRRERKPRRRRDR